MPVKAVHTDNREPQPRVRVAAIILEDDMILLAQHEKKGVKYWVLPGGGVHYGETAERALIRELKEEASLKIRVGDLVLVNDSVPPNRRRHILNLYFTASVVSGQLAVGDADKRLVDMRFVPVKRLARLALFPDIRKELLRGIRKGFGHGRIYLRNLWRDK